MKAKSLIVSLCLIIFFFTDGNLTFAQAAFTTGKIGVIVNSYGRFRFYVPDTSAARSIDRLSVLVGVNSDEVFDYNNDQDVEDSTTNVDPPTFGDYEIYGSYNNNYSGAPPDVLVKMHVFGWNDEAFAVVKFMVINRESFDINAITGLDIIPQVNTTYENDTIWYNTENNVLYCVDSFYVGIKMVMGETKSARIFDWYDGYSVDSSYYSWLTYNNYDTDSLVTTEDGAVIILAGDSSTIATGDTVTIYSIVAFGADENEMLANMSVAEGKLGITGISDNNILPSNFVLRQNYPNPFNPSTIISFNLPVQQHVKLAVYNAIGQEVRVLLNGETSAGYHQVVFNAENLPSGIYFYKLFGNQYSSTKKMILVK